MREKSRSGLARSSHKSSSRNPQPVRSAGPWTSPLRPEVQTQHLRQGWAGASEPLLGALSLCQSTQDEVLLEDGWLGSRKKDLEVEVS